MKMLKFIKSKLVAMLTIVFMLGINSTSVFASTVQDSKLVTGTTKLINDTTKALMVLSPIIGVLLVIYFLIRRGAADEMDQKRWNNRINVVIVSVIGVVLAAALINVVIGYYQ